MYRNQEIGKIGEKIAQDYLMKKNYSILEKNFSCYLGEIDIIAKLKNNHDIIFIEVKTRTQSIYGRPAEAVNTKKLMHLYRVAEYYLKLNHFENNPIQFDVIEILHSENLGLRNTKLHHIQNILYDSPYTLSPFISFKN